MNEIVNNFLLAGNKFMSEMHLHTVLEDHLKKRGLLSMLLGTLGASLLRNLLAGKSTIIAVEEVIARTRYN